jgi:NAD(P)-dependent dehydrogenase (short-subunit alcohol dehydrogenase family)
VRFFASQKSQISILDISAASAESVVSSLRSEYPGVTFLSKKCDVADWDEQKRVFAEVYQELGGIDIVFANAGVTELGSFVQKDEGEPTKPNLRTLEINLIGNLYSEWLFMFSSVYNLYPGIVYIYLTYSFAAVKLGIHYLRKNEAAYKGSIICTASNAGIYYFPIAPIYATSKHGVVGAVRSLEKSLELEGIQINALAPAVIGIASLIILPTRLFPKQWLTN